MKNQMVFRKRIIMFSFFSVLASGVITAFAAPPVFKMSGGTFETRNIMKAFRVDKTKAFKGDAETIKLAERLFNYSQSSERAINIQLKSDGNQLLFLKKNDLAAHFSLDKDTGDISFQRGMKAYANNTPTNGLPRGEKEAVDSAKRILRDLELMPENQEELVVRHVGGMKLAERTERGETREVEKLVTVHFGRKIDGVDVGGPGSKIVVSIGSNGELVALTRRWIEVQKEAKAADKFYAKDIILKNVQSKLVEEASKAKSINSSLPDSGYYDDGKGNIEPAYFVVADIQYDERNKFSQLSVVPALRDAKADFSQLERVKTMPKITERLINNTRRDSSDE